MLSVRRCHRSTSSYFDAAMLVMGTAKESTASLDKPVVALFWIFISPRASGESVLVVDLDLYRLV